jgi:hypothetical protein
MSSSRPRWKLSRHVVVLLGALALTACARWRHGLDAERFPASPAEARFETDDLRRFWAAYDAGGRDGDASAFQRIYLDAATPGLRDFIRVRQLTAASIAGAVTRYRAYYAALSASARTVSADDAVFATIRRGYERIESLYPAAFYPPVTLLYGRFSTGGTTGPNGLLLGMEFYGRDVVAPTGELNAFSRGNQFSLQRHLPALVAHEHAHMLQQAAGARGGRRGATVLEASLVEGGADLVAELAIGQPSYADHYAEWQPREAEFWRVFQLEMNGTNIGRWLYNQGTGTTEWPGDLGYFIGYRIAQAYYVRAVDKAVALRTLIAQRDPQTILRESGYAGGTPVRTSESH